MITTLLLLLACAVTGDVCPDSTYWASNSNGHGYGTRTSTHYFDGTPDYAFELGWNQDQYGLLDPDLHKFVVVWESDYDSGADNWTEWHVQYSKGSTYRRPIGISINLDNHSTNVALEGKITLGSGDGTKTRVSLQDQSGVGGMFLYDTFIGWTSSNQNMLRAWDGSKWVEMVKVDAYSNVVIANRFKVAPTAPTVTDCGDLITALAQMGLVVDGR